jgi:hypothetical protein
MTDRLAILVIAAAIVIGVPVAYAHHSFLAMYEASKIVAIEGTLAQMLLRNPHSFLMVDARGISGQAQRWSLEWGGATQLRGHGVGKDTLKVGDKLIITANPARGSENSTRALVKTVRQASGPFQWGNLPGQVVE